MITIASVNILATAVMMMMIKSHLETQLTFDISLSVFAHTAHSCKNKIYMKKKIQLCIRKKVKLNAHNRQTVALKKELYRHSRHDDVQIQIFFSLYSFYNTLGIFVIFCERQSF